MHTILIADDEKDVRELVKARFEFNGFKCITASNGEDAIKLAMKKKPSFLILDLIMPDMDGFEVYKVLKANKKTDKIHILIYSAQPSEIIAKKDMESLDIVDFIMKPFDADLLVSSVKDILKNKKNV
jgi:DNA-binding response OmpR family regulator